jgi:5-methyltetrahydrofolate--homocysteine methyltransferase
LQAVENRDSEFIRELALAQADSGARYIDVNCGTFINDEPEIITWMANENQSVVSLPLCIDSPNPKAIEAA